MAIARTAIGLFLLQTQIKLQNLLQYRADFLLGIFMTFFFSTFGPLFQLLIYTRSKGYPGWGLNQILLFQGILLMSSSLREVLFGEVRGEIDRLMHSGDFDRLLMKPFPPLLYLLTGGFSPYAFGALLLGIGVTAWAWVRSGAPLTVGSLALFFIFLTAGVLLSLSVTILYCSLTVWWVYSMRLSEIMDKVLRFSEFPLEVYPTIIQTAFITVLPFAVATYLPAQALLGRIEWTALIALIGAVVFCLGMMAFWNQQLKRYASGGG